MIYSLDHRIMFYHIPKTAGGSIQYWLQNNNLGYIANVDPMHMQPRSFAKYREVDSNAAFATPIQSYFGQATCPSKSRPTTDPPPLKSGRAAIVKDLSEKAEI